MARSRVGTVKRLALAAGLMLGLSACFRPLYGPTPSGAPLSAVLASIQVDQATTPQGQERLGHYLRSELVFDLDGSGQPSEKRYRLELAVSETVQTPIVSSVTARAESATLYGTATYKVVPLDGSRSVTDGTATGLVTYDRSVQRFASLRAAREAEIRLAKLLADQIKARVAAMLATQP
ncbi:LPS assembly lipoprotein LptE [Methylobacterium sp. ID0610]|uniref:LPS assembly lipoprotein LptE n=1 Tax=Methylobacterium carpenticola TaxID=3344827 RepID=UPI00369799A1